MGRSKNRFTPLAPPANRPPNVEPANGHAANPAVPRIDQCQQRPTYSQALTSSSGMSLATDQQPSWKPAYEIITASFPPLTTPSQNLRMGKASASTRASSNANARGSRGNPQTSRANPPGDRIDSRGKQFRDERLISIKPFTDSPCGRLRGDDLEVTQGTYSVLRISSFGFHFRQG